jgi:hypothetical protein
MAQLRKWRAKQVIDATEREAVKRMHLATIYVKDQTKRLINVGNPGGDNPSAEGDPPKKVTARLFNGINHQVVQSRRKIAGYVGTNVVYARRLELGFRGMDSKGRHYDQEERPYLRRALFESLEMVRKILGVQGGSGGTFKSNLTGGASIKVGAPQDGISSPGGTGTL